MDAKAVVIGAAGGIGAAVARILLAQGYAEVHTISREAAFPDTGATHWQTDHSDASLAEIVTGIDASAPALERLVICPGVLQGEGFRPERALRQLEEAAAAHVYAVNTLLPMRWLAIFQPLLKKSERPRVAVLSARVGSIGDNRLGGWYSYRASKAALNMMLQCASVECARLNKAVQIVAYHPGTVDTELSRPFQRGVPAEKLFTPAFTAQRLVGLLDTIPTTGTLAYLDWDGKPIPF